MKVWTALIFCLALCVTSEEFQDISCILGDGVSFKCPCDNLEDCTLKKSNGEYLLRRGLVNNQSLRCTFDRSSYRFTLKEYREEDEGSYTWMCKEPYHFELYELKNCHAGKQTYFKCPCCPEEFDSCTFKKLGQGGYILHGGAFNDSLHKYQMDEHRAHITLTKCHEDDEGIYVWVCKTCSINKTSALKVPHHDWKPLNRSSGAGAILQQPYLCVLLLAIISGTAFGCKFMKFV